MKWVLVILLIAALDLKGSSQHKSPLDEYLNIAIENNPDIKSLFYQYLAALEKAPQNRSLPDPTIMFNVFTSPVETRVGAQRAGIVINQAFPWFGQLKSQESAAIEYAKSRFELFEAKKNKIAFEVQSIYFRWYLLDVTTSILEENIKLLNSFRELANIKLQSGKGSVVDILRLEIDLAEFNNQLQYLNDSRTILQQEFNEKLGGGISINIQLPDSLTSVPIALSKSVLLDSLLQHNPSLRSFDYELSTLESKIDVAEKMGLPSFNLSMSYINVQKRSDIDIADNGKDAFIFPQVGVRVPIFKNKYKSMVKEQQHLIASKIESKNSQLNNLNTKLEGAWRDHQDALRRVELYKKLQSLSNQSIDILLARYTSEGTDFEEILRMERNLLRYKLELEKARVDMNTSAAYINYLVGKTL